MQALAFYDQAKAALQKAIRLDEVKDLRDKAEVLRLYTKQVSASLELQNYCAEIKIRAERRAGELLRDDPELRRRRSARLLLLGIKKHQSSRWQRIAKLDAALFERFLVETTAAGMELTSAGVEREARKREAIKLPPAAKPTGATKTADAGGRTPYVQWVTFLNQMAALLEEMNRLGGFQAVIQRLSPAQVDVVVEQVHRI